jgi:hypothetical protein
VTGERAPVQMSPKLRKPPGTVSWAEHVEAWESYAKRHGYQQSAERMAERGGFGYCELVTFLGRDPLTWEPSQKPLTQIEKAAFA